MRTIRIAILSLFMLNCIFAHGESKEISFLKKEVKMLQISHNHLQQELDLLKGESRKVETRINILESSNKRLDTMIDSLQHAYNVLASHQENDKTELSTSINQTNNKIKVTEATLSSRTIWGLGSIIFCVFALVAMVWTFMRKFKSGTSSIDDIRKAQAALEQAQEKLKKAQLTMQEETIQLDNRLIEILSKHPLANTNSTGEGALDHSLTLKIADEIVKIEMNLARMDENIKGYKQLARGVQRIKDNFKANEYEIVDMLGKTYQEGIKAAVTFVTDETLEPGQQIISRVIKPQVNFKQIMIQSAQIEVSQAE